MNASLTLLVGIWYVSIPSMNQVIEDNLGPVHKLKDQTTSLKCKVKPRSKGVQIVKFNHCDC
jgi:hypothetical protein